jgi:hypothetical protein
MAAMER